MQKLREKSRNQTEKIKPKNQIQRATLASEIQKKSFKLFEVLHHLNYSNRIRNLKFDHFDSPIKGALSSPLKAVMSGGIEVTQKNDYQFQRIRFTNQILARRIRKSTRCIGRERMSEKEENEWREKAEEARENRRAHNQPKNKHHHRLIKLSGSGCSVVSSEI